MAVKPTQVFLVPGQVSEGSRANAGNKVEGQDPLKIQHRVVVAEDSTAALRLLAQREPGYRPLGHTSLQEFRDAEAQIRASLNGDSGAWPLVVAPGMG